MRVKINGRCYRLKEEIAIRLQGVALILIGIACHKIQADGAAVFMCLYGMLLYLSAIGKSKRKGIIYRIAKTYIVEKEGSVDYVVCKFRGNEAVCEYGKGSR